MTRGQKEEEKTVKNKWELNNLWRSTKDPCVQYGLVDIQTWICLASQFLHHDLLYTSV